MAWKSELKPGEEIVLAGCTVVRNVGSVNTKIEVETIPGRPEMPIVKRRRLPDGE